MQKVADPVDVTGNECFQIACAELSEASCPMRSSFAFSRKVANVGAHASN